MQDSQSYISGYSKIDSESDAAPISVSQNLVTSKSVRTFLPAAAWFSLALIGQAASLQMIDAGRLIHFEHYRPIAEILNRNALPLFIFVLQTVIVGFAIGKNLGSSWNWIRKTFKLWRFGLAIVFLFFAGAALTPDVSVYLTSLVLNAWIQSVGLATIILMVWSIPEESLTHLKKFFGKFFVESADTRLTKDRFVWIAAIWTVLLTGMLSYFVYQAHPHVPDESQYLFQAKYMAAGQLTVKPPAVPEAFNMYMIPYQDSRWYGIFPPGWPAMLALGTLAGMNWLANPLLAGLCILLAYSFLKNIYSRGFARLAVVLLCCSPWFIFMGMSFMSHMFTLACALCGAVALQRYFKSGRNFYALLSGLAIGCVALIRPLDGAIIAVLIGIWALLGSRTWRTRIFASALLGVGTLIVTAPMLFVNKAVTGSATLLPMDAYYNKYFWPNVMALGFGSDRGIPWPLDAFPGHSPFESLINAALNTYSVNTELFGWSVGSLIFVVMFLLFGKTRKTEFWALAVIAAVIGSYSLYWYHGGPDFGARYWFLCIVPLIALTVKGIAWLSSRIEEKEILLNHRVGLAVAAVCVMSLVSYFPWRSIDKYHHYLNMQPGVQELAEKYNFGKSLVLIRGNEYADYQSAWIYNPVNFEGDSPIYALDKNEEIRSELLNAYSDRPVWIVDGPSRTNGNYAVTAGPISAQELLSKKN